MAAEMGSVELYLVIDDAGDYEVACDRENALDLYAENIGGNGARRVVCVELKVPLPVDVTMKGEVPELANEGQLSAE